MRTELEKALADEFPFMRRCEPIGEQTNKGSIDNTYEAFGLECSSGWYQLIHDMCAEITAAFEAEGKPVDIVVDQVKEKFGTLRFYYHHAGQPIAIHAFDCLSDGSSLRARHGDSEIHRKVEEIVDRYEDMSGRVCEYCGAAGRHRDDLSWMRTLCEEHYQKVIEKSGRRPQC